MSGFDKAMATAVGAAATYSTGNPAFLMSGIGIDTYAHTQRKVAEMNNSTSIALSSQQETTPTSSIDKAEAELRKRRVKKYRSLYNV